MNNYVLKPFYNLRRYILKYFIPELVWPKEVIIDNVKIKLRGAPYSFGIKLILNKGEYECPERNLLRSIDLNGETVIEMGGSIGILTAILANKVGSNGKVISVEASQRLTSYSKSWLEINQNIKVITGFGFPVLKVKSQIDILKFDESGSSLVGQIVYKNSNKNLNNESSIYDIQKISNLFNITPTILIIDIEGSEKIIIEQKPDFPSTIKLLLLELHPGIYGESIKLEIINRVITEGFTIKASEENVYLFYRD